MSKTIIITGVTISGGFLGITTGVPETLTIEGNEVEADGAVHKPFVYTAPLSATQKEQMQSLLDDYADQYMSQEAIL